MLALCIDIPARKQHGPCPVCFGTDRFRFDDRNGRGTWFCNQCDPQSGDGLDLVGRVFNKTPMEAAKMVAVALGLSDCDIDPAELERMRSQQAERAEKDRQEDDRKHQEAAAMAKRIIEACQKAAGHAYMDSKGLGRVEALLTASEERIGGVTFPAGSLAVPLMADAGGEPVNVQLIADDGDKCFLSGGQVTGAFHIIQGGDTVAICEGYATGVTVHQLTGWTVYCAMSANNLLSVARHVRDRLNPEQLLIAADNDDGTDGNPGKAKAEAAAGATGSVMVIPPEAGDWDDYRKTHGVAAARAEIELQAIEKQNKGASQGEDGAPLLANVVPLRPDTNTDTERAEVPTGFELDDTGIWFFAKDKADKWEKIRMCSPLNVLAGTSDPNDGGYGRLLEWKTTRGNVRRWVMPMAMLSGNGEELRRKLLDSGIGYVSPYRTARDKLLEFLARCQPTRSLVCLERTGWHDGCYVLPSVVIGPNAEGMIFQSGRSTGDGFGEAGSLSDWKASIGSQAVNNSRLCFALSLAFAAPLLSLVGMEGGGFHLKGESGDGKSTILECAASVYGHPGQYVHTWRATGNAIEGIASRRNDALLCLDELIEMDGREAGQTAYMLANGQGKGRSRQDGDLRERKQWRLLFLSTGELSLADHAAEAGKRTYAGAEVRTIQIPSQTGQHGAFECLHGKADGRAFSDTLKEVSKRYYGSPLLSFVTALTGGEDQYGDRLRGDVKRLAAELTPAGAGNQVGRAINRFALVAAAGELATDLGITGWPAGEATRAARICLAAWLEERGGLGNHEDAAALEQVRRFFTSNQFSRFADWNDALHRPANMVGYRRSDANEATAFYVMPAAWAEITKGFDGNKVARLCQEKGYLLGEAGRPQRKIRLPGSKGSTRVYHMTERVLGSGE